MGCCGEVIHGALSLAKCLAGKDAAPDDVVAQRRDACRNCDEATRNAKYADRPSKGLTVASRCNKCGCSVWCKTMLAGEACPLGKWPKASRP
jgi:hypothetical protein